MTTLFYRTFFSYSLQLALGFISHIEGTQVEVYPQSPVIFPGTNLTIAFKVKGSKFSSCRYELDGKDRVTFNFNKWVKIFKNYSYAGSGLNNGDCSISIGYITDYHDGQLSCELVLLDVIHSAIGSANITVARKPNSPQLTLLTMSSSPTSSSSSSRVMLPRDHVFKEGDTLLAVCNVTDGRPQPTVTWFIGDQLITTGVEEIKTADEARRTYNILQTMNRTLDWRDNGRQLSCVSRQHVTFENHTDRSNVTLNVGYTPKGPVENPIKLYDFVLHREANISVDVHCRPLCSFRWLVGGVIAGKTKEFYRSKWIELDHQRQRIILTVVNLTTELERKYFQLVANNTHGKKTFNISIFAKPMPATGTQDGDSPDITLIALVVAIVLVLLVFALILCRYTKRLCFQETEPAKEVLKEYSEPEMVVYAQINKKTMSPRVRFSLDEMSAGANPAQRQQNDHMRKGKAGSPAQPNLIYAELDLNTNPTCVTKRRPEEKVIYSTVVQDKSKTNSSVTNQIVYAELDIKSNPSAVANMRDERTVYSELMHPK